MVPGYSLYECFGEKSFLDNKISWANEGRYIYMLCLSSLVSKISDNKNDVIIYISVYTINTICISASSANKIASELCRRGL